MNTKKIIKISINIKRITEIMIIFKILFFILFSISCHGNFGVDLSIKLEQSEWLQLEVQFGVTISSASLHILFYNQTLNSNAPISLISASNSGIFYYNINYLLLPFYINTCLLI